MERRLQRWVEAGLITTEQAQRILAFEREESRPLFVYAITALAGLAIAVGLVSIVAANWDVIPGRVKIALDLLLVGGLGAGVLWWERRGPAWARETVIVVTYGSMLASIALVGQVYQLGGRTHEALALWSALTFVLMTRARSAFVAVVWLLGLQVTYGAQVVHFLDRLDGWEPFVASTIYWVPLACILLGQSRAIRTRRPALAEALQDLGWLELVACATAGTFAFYGDTSREDWSTMVLGATVSLAVTAWIARRLPSSEARRQEQVLLGLCFVLAHLPWPVSPGDLELVAALGFIGLWVWVAYTAHQARRPRLLNTATAFIGLRIITVYFEVFGTLLDTGLGLVLGGVLTLGLVWLWARKRKDFEEELGSGGDA